jgi:hypothetical protein
MRWALWPGVLVGALAGCAGQPTVAESDQSFVTVTRPARTPLAAVKELAQRTCGWYKKRAVFLDEKCTSAACTEHEVTFWCQP